MNKRKILVGVAAVLFLVVVLGAILLSQWPAGSLHSTDNHQFGNAIFNDYGLAILIVGITLFVSMLGGVYIAQEEKE
jgi:NADH:ubiquinone oxidoreductase subunit 6 (subunit J)